MRRYEETPLAAIPMSYRAERSDIDAKAVNIVHATQLPWLVRPFSTFICRRYAQAEAEKFSAGLTPIYHFHFSAAAEITAAQQTFNYLVILPTRVLGTFISLAGAIYTSPEAGAFLLLALVGNAISAKAAARYDRGCHAFRSAAAASHARR